MRRNLILARGELNADPIWLHQEALWEHLMPEDEDGTGDPPAYGLAPAVTGPFQASRHQPGSHSSLQEKGPGGSGP